MSDEELIKWFKRYTTITKKDNEIAETVGLELNVEISVEMAERLINLIEKQQSKIDKVKNQLKNQIEHCENENAELYDKCSINLRFNKGLLKLLEE